MLYDDEFIFVDVVNCVVAGFDIFCPKIFTFVKINTMYIIFILIYKNI